MYCVCVCVCMHAQSCLTLCDPMAWLLCLWNLPGKNTGVDCHFLLQGIFPTQGLNPCVLHWQAILYLGSPKIPHATGQLSPCAVTRQAPMCHSENLTCAN